jgi:hypothetical protein
MKEFNESRVGQSISVSQLERDLVEGDDIPLEVWDIVMFAAYQDNTTNA